MGTVRPWSYVVGLLALFSLMSTARAQEVCVPAVGWLASAEGVVELQRAGTFVWEGAVLDETLCQGDAVRAGAYSRAAVRLINDAVLRLDQNTTVHLTDIRIEPEERSFLDMVRGVLQSFSRSPRLLAVNTPYLNATIEGTEFVVRADEAESSITVLEGVVAAANELGEVRLAAGEAAVAPAGEAPRPLLVVRPRDAVQWALHYPPILAALGGQTERLPPDLPAPLAEATRRAQEGDIGGAFEVLDRVPEAERDARHHVYRAGLLLSVGRVDQANEAIESALAEDPASGLALAQRAIIRVVQNEVAQAREDARQAVELNPDLSAPRIALSYALQADFQLGAARGVLLGTVERHPEDALAWARLAELWLSTGYRGRARAAAARAVELAPDLARTQVVLGFANLVEFRTTAARAAFADAIELAPGDPLPRFGLGLAQIRESDLQEGRQNIEVAVALDANSSILRSYLGKAYFEEVRTQLANEQYALAKELDPFDPTPHLYDAIKLQTENRPVEALRELQTSIELNDNRAVYRSRLQLEEDRAARGTSLARVYDDLGFTRLGQLEATRSLTLDPTNAAAHRFLSDIYRDERRRETARVSELLQAQMLQDININPVQPSISETNLNIVTQGGPAEPGFNEFTPLFERQRAQLNATGFAGNNETYGGEGVLSMVYDRYSLSAGAFHFQTDGWRPNHDIRHNLQNVFFQAAITPELNAQVEFRRRDSEIGDLALNFDPDVFFPNFRRQTERNIARAGVRYSPTPSSDILVSFIYTDVTDEATDMFETPDGLFEVEVANEDQGYQVEAQYLFRSQRFNLIAGAAFSDFDLETNILFTQNGDAIIDFAGPEDLTQIHPYVYGYLNLPDSVLWTLGVTYDDIDRDFEDGGLRREKANPKFGVQWFVTDDLVLRGAVFRHLKQLLTSDQTLEPTHVAGFNQFFDDRNWVSYWRYGIGVDWRVRDNLFVGAEATWRDLDVPFVLGDVPNEFFDWHEERHRAYLNWAPLSQVAVSAEVIYDRFEADGTQPFTIEGEVPEKLTTISVPLGIRYFHPSGFFAGVRASYVRQDVERSPENVIGLADAQGTENFFVFDASVGYRLPRRLGVVSLEAANILDKRFRYQDDSFREFQDKPSIGPYIPDRQILGRITLNW